MEEYRIPGVDDPPILTNVPAENLYHALMVHVIINIFHEYCAEVKRLLPVPNAGGEGLEVTRTVSHENRRK